MSERVRTMRVPDLAEKKKRGEKVVMLTAYDATLARLLDRAGIDAILVGDSLGMVILGHENTLAVTLEAAVHHTRAVSNGAQRALVVADMPFLTYQLTVEDAVRNAGRLIQEGGAVAVKVEGGGGRVAEVVSTLVDVGIPVMGHLGLTPQAVHQLGGFRRKTEEESTGIVEEARRLEQAGAFAVVLECVAPALAKTITQSLAIPTIGIGAGPHCDGQVLVSYDMLGLFQGTVPPFVRRYAELGDGILKAVGEYINDVRNGQFPACPAENGAASPGSRQ